METWQRSELTDFTTQAVIYEAFVEGKLEAPKHLARTVHDLYFEPNTTNSGHERSGVFRMRSPRRSKELEPIYQFKATAKLSEFLEVRFSQAF